MIKDVKTTLFGALSAGLVAALTFAGENLGFPKEVPSVVASVLLTVLGWFARDPKPTVSDETNQ